MKKSISITALLLILTLSTFAQILGIRPVKPGDATYGISKKMIFETIINTDLSQKEMIESTKDIFIKNRLLDSKEFKLDEISDSQTDFVLPFGFRQAMFHGKYALGMGVVKPAVKLFFEAKFSFNKEGQVKITITNFNEDVFFLKDGKGKYGWVDNQGDNSTVEKYREMYNLEMMSKSGIGKFLLALNGGVAELSNTLQEMNKVLDQQFAIIDEVEKSESGNWLVDLGSQVDELGVSVIGAPEKTMRNMIKERVDNGYLLVVDNQRWDEHFQQALITTYIEVAKKINGSIVGIAQDGKMIYENVNGKVLPTDPKVRKKWLKEGISL